jgi:prophage antirepressor-like protein
MSKTLIDLNNNIIYFKNIEITSLLVNNELWVKGIDITRILEYKNINHPLTENLLDRHKNTLENLIILIKNENSNLPDLGRLKKNEKNTIYINEIGLYRLLLKSRLPIAEEFQVWLENDVLPSIRKSGSYSIQCNNNNLLENEKTFWDENSISDFNNKKVVYIAYIGIYNNEHLYKFGKSEQVYTREFDQHQKTFEIFRMKHIELCDNMSFVEKELKKELKSKNLLRNIEIKSKNNTELFTVTPQNNIDKIIEILKDLIDKYPNTVAKEYTEKNEKLEFEIEFYKKEIDFYKRENESKERENTRLNDTYELFKQSFNDIKIEKNKLTMKIESFKDITHKIENLENQNENLKQEILKNNQENENIQTKMDEIKQENENLKEELINIKSQNFNVLKENEDLKQLKSNLNAENMPKFLDKETRGKLPKGFRPLELTTNDISKKCKNNDEFCNNFIEIGEDNPDNIDNRYLMQTTILYYIYKANTQNPLGQMTFYNYIQSKYNIKSQFVKWPDGQKLQTYVGIKLKKCPNKIFNNDKETDDFVKDFIIFGEETSKTQWRTRVCDVYDLYVQKTNKPLCKFEFNYYITEKYNIIRKSLGSYQYWVGVVLNIPKTKSRLEIFLDDFIEKHCTVNENLQTSTAVFNKVFRNYCEENDYFNDKHIGLSVVKCKLALNERGFKEERKTRDKVFYNGIECN